MSTETEFLARNRPASNSPSPGIIARTAMVEMSIHVVSAGSMVRVSPPSV